MKKPASSDAEAWLAALHSAAATASGALVEFHYLEQQYERAGRALCRAHPQDWKLQPSEPRCHVVVCFRWQPRGSQAVPASMTHQRIDVARNRSLLRPPTFPKPRSLPCVSWAARALEIVEQAGKTFVEVYAHALQEQIGLQLDCVYALR